MMKYLIIMVLALSVMGCGTTKKAVVTVEEEKLSSLQQTTDAWMTMESETDPPVLETATLSVPADQIAALPEDAEYSTTQGTLRVTVGRGKGDSLRISAQGIRPGKQKVLAAGDLTYRSEYKDSTRTKISPPSISQPRGQPEQHFKVIVTIVTIGLVLIGLIVYDINKRKNNNNNG